MMMNTTDLGTEGDHSGLIVSVGGSPEPIIASVRKHAPKRVCFYASGKTVENVGKIKDVLCADGFDILNENIVVDDPEHLIGCYEVACRCVDRVESGA